MAKRNSAAPSAPDWHGGAKISYLANKNGTEVDFLARDPVSGAERLVQVAYAMSEAQTFNREMNALKAGRDATGIRDCAIVTWDDEGEIDGIRVVPAWKWLLEK